MALGKRQFQQKDAAAAEETVTSAVEEAASTSSIARKMEAILARVAEEADSKEEVVDRADDNGPTVQAYCQRFLTNTTVRKRLAEVEKTLARYEQQGLFVSYPISPGNEYPTLMTRLPIFRPTRNSHQKRLVNSEFALEFETPFGSGKRHGPPLTVRDEDTLIAITRLRSKRLYGRPQSLPVPIEDVYAHKDGNDTVGVHFVVCTVDQINRELGLTDGGVNYKRTFDSVRRLGATRLELNLKTHDRYLGEVQTGRMLSLIDVQWQSFKENGLLVILFTPVIAHWLEKHATYIDWPIRLQLDDLGKCLHRFLSSQPKSYKGELAKIALTVGYDGPSKNIRQRFGRSLDKLVELSWLDSYEISGNGRSQPLVLRIKR